MYFKTDVAAMISYKVSVEDEDIADFEAIPTGEDTATNEHEFQVIGLVPNCTNKVTFTIKYKDGSKKISTYNYNPGSTLGDEETKLSGTGGQHTVTYEESDELSENQYYLYMFDNNLGISESRSYDWTQIEGIATSITEDSNSYYYKYLVDENKKTYTYRKVYRIQNCG